MYVTLMGNQEDAKTGFTGEFGRQRYNQANRNAEMNLISAKLAKRLLGDKM